MSEAIIFVGVQGAGKTTFYVQQFLSTHVRLSRDLAGSPEREQILLRACLQARLPFVVDNTNVTAASRSAYIAVAKACGFRTLAYYFDVPMRTAIGRNNHRTDKKPIPVPAIVKLFKQIEPPTVEEGFDEIRRQFDA